MIEAIKLKKQFGRVTAVEDASFLAEDGVVTGLLGHNGAGKTTTMRMITGLVHPDSGTVLVDNVPLADDPLGARGKMGVLPDTRGLYPRLTTREHIAYFAELQAVPSGILKQRVAEILDILGMQSIADRPVEGFSQGERTKVAIARALVHNPNNVLLDEPTNGLDVMSTLAVREVIRALKAQGRCVIFSSHIMQEVAALCDRIVVLGQGRVLINATPEELMARTGRDTLEEAFLALATQEEAIP